MPFSLKLFIQLEIEDRVILRSLVISALLFPSTRYAKNKNRRFSFRFFASSASFLKSCFLNPLGTFRLITRLFFTFSPSIPGRFHLNYLDIMQPPSEWFLGMSGPSML
jgi:hypothetical protein